MIVVKYVSTDLQDESVSNNVYDYVKAFIVWWSGLGIVYILVGYFQKIFGLPIVKSENLSFIFAPLLFIIFICGKNEVSVVKNNINFLNKVSQKSIYYKANDYLYYYLEIISIIYIFLGLIGFKEMESAIMLGYSIGVRWVIANIKGEKEVEVVRRYIKNIVKIYKILNKS